MPLCGLSLTQIGHFFFKTKALLEEVSCILISQTNASMLFKRNFYLNIFGHHFETDLATGWYITFTFADK